MKMLKLIVLSLVVFGGAQSATLTYISSATTNTEAGSLLFAPATPLFDAAFVYLIQIDSEFDDAVERSFLSNEDEASNEPDNLTTDSEYIRIRPRGPRGIPVPDVSIDSLVPVSANFTKSVEGTGESTGSSFSSRHRCCACRWARTRKCLFRLGGDPSDLTGGEPLVRFQNR